MRPSSRSRIALMAALATFYLAPGLAHAGVSLWTSQDLTHSLYLELTRPDLEGFEQGTGTGAGSAEAVFAISPHVALVARLPAAFPDLTYTGPGYYHHQPDSLGGNDSTLVRPYSDSQFAVGNLYTGVRFRPAGIPALTLELGVHSPTASSPSWAAAIVGVGADLAQWEDYRRDGSIDVAARIRPRRRGRLADVWEFRWVTDVWNLDYGVAVDFLGRALLGCRLTRAAWVWGGLDTRLSSSSGSDSPIQAQAVLAGTADLGSIRPGLHLRLPLGGDLRQVSTWAIGLSCEASPWPAERSQ